MAENLIPNPGTKPAKYYSQYWKSEADGYWYGHVKGRNHQVVFPSQRYKTARSFKKLMANIGWTAGLIPDPNGAVARALKGK